MSPKNAEQTVSITFRVAEDLRDRAIARANERRDNLSEILRDALRRYIEPDQDLAD